MSRGRTPATHRGPQPRGTLTLKEAAKLPVFVGKSDETVRRGIASAFVGFWKPDGSRGVSAIYDARAVETIADALSRVTTDVAEEPARAPSAPRRVQPDGWATAAEIQLMLREHGIDSTYFTPRWLRERLLKLRVPADKRVVRVQEEWLFQMDKAVAALKKDRLVKARIGR